MSILIRVVVPIVNILMRVELARIEVRNLIESVIQVPHFIRPPRTFVQRTARHDPH